MGFVDRDIGQHEDSMGGKDPEGSDHDKILIFNNKHCIFKRISALNDPFGGQNGPFKKKTYKWAVPKDIIFPDTCGTPQINGLVIRD